MSGVEGVGSQTLREVKEVPFPGPNPIKRKSLDLSGKGNQVTSIAEGESLALA